MLREQFRDFLVKTNKTLWMWVEDSRYGLHLSCRETELSEVLEIFSFRGNPKLGEDSGRAGISVGMFTVLTSKLSENSCREIVTRCELSECSGHLSQYLESLQDYIFSMVPTSSHSPPLTPHPGPPQRRWRGGQASHTWGGRSSEGEEERVYQRSEYKSAEVRYWSQLGYPVRKCITISDHDICI